jgi:hypothetical protein
MIAIALVVLIALVVGFVVLDRRWSAEPSTPDAEAADAEAADAEAPPPAARGPEDLERDVYRELYAERSGDVSPRRTRSAAGR